jgi:hypothetical protein
MPCKKPKRKMRKTRHASFKANQPMKLIGDATKATVGIAALGVTAAALTNLKP